MLKYMFTAAALLIVCCSQAQRDAVVETTIRELEQTVVKGILEADTHILKQVWAPEFVVNTPHNTIAKNREAVFQNQQRGLINYSSFERTIESILIQGNMVITMGHETFVSRNDIPGAKAGQPIKRRFTNIWMQKEGKWLQVARHASIICSQ